MRVFLRKLLGSRIFFVAVLSIASLFVALPRHIPLRFSWSFPLNQGLSLSVDRTFSLPPFGFSLGSFSFFRSLDLYLGLDLAGGSHLVFEADMSQIGSDDQSAALESVRDVIERRVNLFGVSEASVQTAKVGDSYRVAVDLPGVSDTREAVSLIGKTAQLDFRAPELVEEKKEEGTVYTKEVKSTGFTGADFKRARPGFDPQTGSPVVLFETKSESAQKFAEITERLIGEPLSIYLDDELISSPVVSQAITDGSGQITGNFTVEGVRRLSSLLNSGALPVPVKIIEQRTLEASLGAESVQASLIAGLIGLGMVLVFMIAYYGRLGFLATVALLIYGLITISIYKLLPVVLTLPGVAGFILSLGLAVDTNILIFERMREELSSGRVWRDALEAGFARAWKSIRDANIAALFVVFVLFNPVNLSFLHTSGPVRGFAATLGIGILVSLFTGVFVTRALLRTFVRKEDG